MSTDITWHVSELFKLHGSDAWYTLPLKELLPLRYHSQIDMLTKGDQVFDVWFDNSFTWDFVLRS